MRRSLLDQNDREENTGDGCPWPIKFLLFTAASLGSIAVLKAIGGELVQPWKLDPETRPEHTGELQWEAWCRNQLVSLPNGKALELMGMVEGTGHYDCPSVLSPDGLPSAFCKGAEDRRLLNPEELLKVMDTELYNPTRSQRGCAGHMASIGLWTRNTSGCEEGRDTVVVVSPNSRDALGIACGGGR